MFSFEHKLFKKTTRKPNDFNGVKTSALAVDLNTIFLQQAISGMMMLEANTKSMR